MFSTTVLEFLKRGCSINIGFVRDHLGPQSGSYQIELLGNDTPTVYAEGKHLATAAANFNAEVERRKGEIDYNLIPLD